LVAGVVGAVVGVAAGAVGAVVGVDFGGTTVVDGGVVDGVFVGVVVGGTAKVVPPRATASRHAPPQAARRA
jgi:hypothetical protein